MDIKKMIKIGKLAKEIKNNDRVIQRYQKDNEELMRELNEILVETGNNSMTLEEILQMDEDENQQN